MEGLDQVSDDPGCYETPRILLPAVKDSNLRRPDDPRGDRWARIARTIEAEVIPRLLLAHRGAAQRRNQVTEAVTFDVRTPERFGHVVLTQQEDYALDFIYSLLETGLPLESIYLDLLAPTARWLGQKWNDDELSFTDVTIALARLQRIMRLLAAAAQRSGPNEGDSTQLVLLANMPNDHHMFGVLMLEEFCRREGFNVECLPGCSRSDLLTAVRRRSPDIVGLSVSVDERLDDLRHLVSDIRKSCGNPNLVVMVGGRCFNDHPEYVRLVGADFTAVDGREAIGHIHSHLSKKTNTRPEP